MKIHLVRHARAEPRAPRAAAGEQRPLSAEGCLQAEALADLLRAEAPTRLLASPILRCRQTLQPLAAALRLPLEVDERLAEGSASDEVLEVWHALRGEAAVVCSHGDAIPGLLERLEVPSAFGRPGEIRCEPASVWTLEEQPDGRTRGDYRPPPAVRTPAAPVPVPWSQRRRRIAALDLGGRSFRLCVSEVSPAGALEPVVQEREVLHLAAALAHGSRIPPPLARRATARALHLRERATAAGAEQLLVLATSALRDAENGAAVSSRLARALGTPVRVLSGAEEAQLVFRAFGPRVGLGARRTLGIDLGGGSLELAIGNARRIDWATSLELGVARIHAERFRSDPPTSAEVEGLAAHLRARLDPVLPRVEALRPEETVATGGTVAALARIARAGTGAPDTPSPDGVRLQRSELRALADALLQAPQAERETRFGLDPERALLLPAGALVLATLAERLGLESLVACDWGLCEGAILEALGLCLIPADLPA